jgi:DNA-binding NarL/FixJ family response regulator
MGFVGEVKLKTLIVEDNPSYREIMRDSLKTLFPSMIIQKASGGNEAIQEVGVFQPQLIFMDIRLPDENGLHLTERIKANHPDTKVIIMTGYDSVDYREAATRCGANGYIAKDSLTPGQIEKLVKSIAAELNKPL